MNHKEEVADDFRQQCEQRSRAATWPSPGNGGLCVGGYARGYGIDQGTRHWATGPNWDASLPLNKQSSNLQTTIKPSFTLIVLSSS